jgi:hypothetical protein
LCGRTEPATIAAAAARTNKLFFISTSFFGIAIP